MKNFFERYPHSIMTLLLLAVGIASILWGEKIPDHNGQGWDGQIYVALAKNFQQEVFHTRMDSYHTQRIIPSGIVHYGLRLFGQPLDDQHALTGFRIYTLLLPLLSCYLWKGIADELGLSRGGRWLGFIGLFINLANLKMAFYYANTTDLTAFVLGLGMLYYYLRRQSWGVALVTLIGAFTWPSVIFGGIVLLLFPRGEVVVDDSGNGKLNVWMASGVALLLAAMIGAIYFYKGIHDFGWQTAPTVEEVVLISIAGVLAYLFYVIRGLTRGIEFATIGRAIRSLTWGRVAMAVGTYAVARGLLWMLADSSKHVAYGMKHMAFVVTLLPISRPLIFIIAHVIYLGPIILLLIFLWNRYCTTIRSFGLGLTLFLLLNIPLTLSPESRGLLNIFPFLGTFVVLAAEKYRLKPSFYWVFGLLAVVFSKLWYPFNQGSHEAELLEFPAQYLFMNAGPWMANGPYLVHAAAVVIAGVVIFLMLRRGVLAAGHRVEELPKPMPGLPVQDRAA